MTSLAEVLGWKFNHAPGIRTDGVNITEWPGALGPIPTQAEIDQWTIDFAAAKPDLDAAADVDGQKVLRALVAWLAQKFGIPASQARDEIIAIYKTL